MPSFPFRRSKGSSISPVQRLNSDPTVAKTAPPNSNESGEKGFPQQRSETSHDEDVPGSTPTLTSPAPGEGKTAVVGNAFSGREAEAHPDAFAAAKAGLGDEAGTAIPPTARSNSDADANSGTHDIRGAQEPIKMGKLRFCLIFVSQMLSIFLFALDQLIIATAIPRITAEFQSLTEISWIINGFFITMLAFNLAYSQWLGILPSKVVVLWAVFIFEMGSLVSGVAKDMNVLIFGRALAGLGAAGLFSGNLVILAEITTMSQRAKMMGLFGVNFAIASVLGPLIGGAFTDHLTWRWCFYINLPIGGIAFVALLLLLPHQPPLGKKHLWKGYSTHMFWDLAKCDWVGVVLVLGWSVSLILALEWGGATKKWSDGSVIACLVLIPVLATLFFLWEHYLGFDRAMLPLRMLGNRNIAGAAIVSFCGFAVMMIAIYYISVLYQSVFHKSAVTAGVQLLPLIMVQIVFLIGSGRIIAIIGRPWPFIFAGPVLITIASGLLYMVKSTSTNSMIMGFQAILGAGIGLFLQNTILVGQWEYQNEPWMISRATGAGTFFGFTGRIVGISLAGSVFQNTIRQNLDKYAPDLPKDLQTAIASSADAVWTVVPEALRPQVLDAYARTIANVFIIGVPFGIIAVAGSFVIENKRYDLKTPVKTDGSKDVNVKEEQKV